MSAPNLSRMLPPGDRDDAPTLPLAPAAPIVTALDETDASRAAKLNRALTEAIKDTGELLIALATNDPVTRDASIRRVVSDLDQAAPLARLLQRSLSRAPKE